VRKNKTSTRVHRLKTGSKLCNVPCFNEALVARIKSEMPTDAALDESYLLFTALADRTRLRILHALMRAEELCVCDVAHVLGMSIAAASHHLRKLLHLKILKHRNDGKMVYYSLRDRFAAELATHACAHALRQVAA